MKKNRKAQDDGFEVARGRLEVTKKPCFEQD